MFAVVRTGGKQYRVSPGDKIVVEKLDGNAGDKVTLGDILLAGDGGEMKDVNGLVVSAEILGQGKGEKVTVFKKRRRRNYRRKKGHRQQHTILHILAVGDQKAEKKAKPVKAEAAPAEGAPAETAAPAEKAEKKAPAPKAEKTAAAPKAEKKAAAPKAEKPESTKKAAPAKGAAEKAPKTKK